MNCDFSTIFTAKLKTAPNGLLRHTAECRENDPSLVIMKIVLAVMTVWGLTLDICHRIRICMSHKLNRRFSSNVDSLLHIMDIESDGDRYARRDRQQH